MTADEQNASKSAIGVVATPGKNLLMKKKRKVHIHASDKTARKNSKYTTETVSLVGLAIVALLNLHMHYNGATFGDMNPGSLLRIRRGAGEVVEKSEQVEYNPVFTERFENAIARPNGTQCKASPVVFVKTHKTAGTTITNMILRHAERNNLLVGLPIQDHWELAGYPAKFDARLVDPQLEKYDVLCHHFRYDEKLIAPKITAGAAYVTIMRNPISNYESIFGFFRDYPFSQWIGHNGTLKTFLSDPALYYDETTPWYFRAKNYMAFDLGFNNSDPTPDYVKHAIQTMDARFDLVMITDRFEESIILMRDLLCMSEEDVIYLALKVRRETQSTELTQDEARKIREWNSLDTALYDHFEKKLDVAIGKYGRQRMATEVSRLRTQLREVEEKCVDAYAQQRLTPWIRRIKLRRKSGDQCLKMTWGEVKFADHIRSIQLAKDDLPPQPSFIRQHILHHDVQRTVLGESPYIHADLML